MFAVDVLECPECGTGLRILAAIHPPSTTRTTLGKLIYVSTCCGGGDSNLTAEMYWNAEFDGTVILAKTR